MPSDNDVELDFLYFSRAEKFTGPSAEKPYTTAFPVDHIDGAEVTNHEWEAVAVHLRDMRGRLKPDLDLNGFTIVNHSTRLTAADFKVSERVEAQYYPELVDLIRQHFPRYKSVVFLDNCVCVLK